MRVLLWLVLVACSTPAQRQEPTKPPPPVDDEEASVAWQAAQPQPEAGSEWRFDWERHRKSYDELMATAPGETRCDWRVRPPPNVECLPPDRPRWHAAKIRRVLSLDTKVTQVEVDIGEADKLSKDWWGTVIDDQGKAVTEWVHPDNIGLHRSFLTVPIERVYVERKTRAALVKQKPE